MRWPKALQAMFDVLNVVSSGGENLINPACEFAGGPDSSYNMLPVISFYRRSLMFACSPIFVVVVCVFTWSIIKAFRSYFIPQRQHEVLDQTILSIVMCLFLLYPTLVRGALSFNKCIKVGEYRYFQPDLQEICFSHRHATWSLMLMVPMVLLYGKLLV